MADSPIPADEDLRLADLLALEVLDTAAEPRFDRITQAARRLFDVPMAAICLIDRDRQWFKSCAGAERSEAPRSISVCAHAVFAGRPLIVTDMTQDARFVDNPMVTGEMHLRFYAGFPLKSLHGRPLGTLFVAGWQPRAFSDDDRLWMADLATWAERELNLRELEEASATADRHGRRLQVVMDSTADALLAVDEQLTIHTFNRAAEQWFGQPAARIIGQSLPQIMPAAATARVADALRDLLETGQRHGQLPGDLLLPSAGGQPLMAELRIGRTEIGGLACFTLILRDVTESRALEKMKSAFVATVSHELRTPVTSIQGSVKLLLSMKDALPPPQLRLLEIADKNCTRLAHMVNDILDLEKMSSGKLSMHCTRQSLAPWVRHALTTLQPYAQSFGVAVNSHASLTDADAVCDIDEGRITQVIVNLLSNAIKFSPRGGAVQVRLDRHDDSLRLSVIDQGCGIADAFRSRMFERFAQAGTDHPSGQAGTGLGLAICKAIVEQHGGQIGYRSVVGAGSTFFVDLPVAPALASLS